MSDTAPSLIECRGVRKVFRDAERTLEILRGVDLEVPVGGIMAISGASGAGKSTLLHIMGTLDRPTDGEVLFRGEPLHRMAASKVNAIRNREVGFVFQFYHLLPEFTALENVMMPALCKGKTVRACRPRAEELLERVGLRDRMTHKPGKLSGGEQQRAAIARALFNKPSIVLSDEPTGNLDEKTAAVVFEQMLALNRAQATSLVLVTHDRRLARRLDRVMELREGRLHALAKADV